MLKKRFLLRLVSLLPFTLACNLPVNSNSVVDVGAYGAKANDLQDDTDAIVKAIDAASAQKAKQVRFSKGTYIVHDFLIDKPEVELIGQQTKLIRAKANTSTTVVLEKGKGISGFILDGVEIHMPATHVGSKITNNQFKNCQVCVFGYVDGEKNPADVTIQKNTFNGHTYGVLGAFSTSHIHDNTFTNSRSRNIELWAGEGNEIVKNKITGGVTGIIFLTNRQRTGLRGAFENIIEENTLSNISEEAISFDLHGDNLEETGSLKKGIVAEVTIENEELKLTPNFSVQESYKNSYLVPLTGLDKGKAYKIISTGGTDRLKLEFRKGSKIKKDDRFVIAVLHTENTIKKNTIKKQPKRDYVLG
jgi:hypothetical protein